jgi:hypothetical protein
MRLLRVLLGVLAIALVANALRLGPTSARDDVAHSGWVLRRDVPLNHQIVADDLTQPERWRDRMALPALGDLVGRHLVRCRVLAPEASALPLAGAAIGQRTCKRKGDRVGRDDIQPAPVLPPPVSGRAIFLAVAEHEAPLGAAFGPGSWIRPCVAAARAGAKASPPCAGPFEVLAAHRSVGSGDGSWIALLVPNCQSQHLAEFVASDRRFFLVTPPSAPAAR